MISQATQRMTRVAFLVFALDQISKQVVLRFLNHTQEKVIIDGFFKFVHWVNTGAAWSMFSNQNKYLAVVSLIALGVLIYFRHHFDTKTFLGQISLGLIFGGILGNLTDRILMGHVVDFIRFYIIRRGSGDEIGFPAFNVADSAICVGVGLLFLLSWRQETGGAPQKSQA